MIEFSPDMWDIQSVVCVAFSLRYGRALVCVTCGLSFVLCAAFGLFMSSVALCYVHALVIYQYMYTGICIYISQYFQLSLYMYISHPLYMYLYDMYIHTYTYDIIDLSKNK